MPLPGTLSFTVKVVSIESLALSDGTFRFKDVVLPNDGSSPQFITELDGAIYFVEVKGWMDPKSKTKLKRMAKYYPKVDLRVVGAAEYRELDRKLGAAIPGWEAA